MDATRDSTEALREREWRVIVDTIPGLVATLTPSGQVEVVNDQLVQCGQDLEAMKRWGPMGQFMSATAHRPHLHPRITAGEPYDFEACIRRFDGVYRWCQVRGLPLRDTTGAHYPLVCAP
jgi:PAS domain-containing protein